MRKAEADGITIIYLGDRGLIAHGVSIRVTHPAALGSNPASADSLPLSSLTVEIEPI